MLLLLCVDDILFSGIPTKINWFKTEMDKQYKVKTKTVAENFIGLQLRHEKNKTMFVHQQLHINKALEKHGLKDTTKQVHTPLETTYSNQVTDRKQEDFLHDARLYQSIIGCLNYIAISSQPDICYAVCSLTRRNKNPYQQDLTQAKRCLTYLKATSGLGIRYKKNGSAHECDLKVYVDSSFANADERRSIYGYVIYYNNMLLHWRSKSTATVCLSTTEAEFIAAAMAIRDLEWIYAMVHELNVIVKTAIIYCDNQGAVRIFTSEQSTSRTRHLDIRLQFTKHLIKNGKYQIRYITSGNNVADCFTKPLYQLNFERLTHKMLQLMPTDQDAAK